MQPPSPLRASRVTSVSRLKEVRKIKPSCNPEKWALGRINLHSFNNVLSTLSRTRKSNKTWYWQLLYCTSINVKLAYLYWLYKLVLRLAGAFGFLQMTLLLNKFAHTWFTLCIKKREWKRSIVANKTYSLQPMLPLKMHKCTAPSDHLRRNLISRTCNIPNHCKSMITRRSYLN